MSNKNNLCKICKKLYSKRRFNLNYNICVCCYDQKYANWDTNRWFKLIDQEHIKIVKLIRNFLINNYY